ncbi:MAG: deoxyribodipyrimidine photo-lyase [bacterium]
MVHQGIQSGRIRQLNDKGIRGEGDYVLYWMQQSQRGEYNHALEFAIQKANDLQQPLLVVFGLTDDYPEANLRHYVFMLEGLREVESHLAARGIRMIACFGRPDQVALAAGRRASLIVCDCGYLRHQKAWRSEVAAKAPCSVCQVETEVIVPVEIVSDKAEYAARTIRPKITRHLDDYLVGLQPLLPERQLLDLQVADITADTRVDLSDIQTVLGRLKKIDRGVDPVTRFHKGGTGEAKRRFQEFIRDSLSNYSENRDQPQTDFVSHMSMYLHFGQISPLYLALQIKEASGSGLEQNTAAFLDELIIQRELTINFVHFTPDYDSFTCLPGWAIKTLLAHQYDKREYLYTPEQLESSQTHDPYWNAAMKEMKYTGYLHNYLRMYWGKKILEWSPTPEDAFRTALAINNKYFLDGRDPNSFANVAWIFGLHDRPWKERPVFGKVRFLSAQGLERKCDIWAYVRKVESG